MADLDLPVRPGHEHDATALRAHTDILAAIGERGNPLLKMTFKALRNVSLDPWRIGKIVAAALVILHFDHARTAYDAQ